MAKRSAKIILDLEDSVWDPDDKSRTSWLKNIARTNLQDMFAENPKLTFGVRVNNIDSIEFEHDLVLLDKLNTIEWDFIVLPMIESADLIRKYIAAFEEIQYKELIVIIESEKGVRDLPSILKRNISEKISKVHFGHYDYFFGSGEFPIPNQTDIRFWEVSERIISIVESNGYNYIHSPINIMNDLCLLFAVCHNLTKICKREFGVTSVGLRQTMIMQNLNNCPYTELDLNGGVANKKSFAEKIVRRYGKHRSRDFSFSNDVREGIYITPHEYMAARNFLSDHG